MIDSFSEVENIVYELSQLFNEKLESQKFAFLAVWSSDLL